MSYISIPNTLTDSFSLTSAELSFCVLVCRKNKVLSGESVSLSYAEICDGLSISKNTAIKIARALEKKGVLVVSRENKTQNVSLVNCYAFTKEVLS